MKTDFGDRLKKARKEAGYASAADAARAMDMPVSTYQSHENGNRGEISKGSATRYAKFFRCDLTWLLTGDGSINGKYKLSQAGLGGPVIVDLPVQMPIVRMPVRGEVRAGAWLEFEDLQDKYTDPADEYVPVARKERYQKITQFALKVVGASMNRLARPGEYVIVAKWDELGREYPENDEVLVIQRERAMTYEITIKRVKVTPEGEYELWPESDDPRYQEPIALIDRKAPVEIKILGKVIGYYRDET